MTTEQARMPEVGQILFAPGSIGAHPTPEYVNALLEAIHAEFSRVYGNVHQRMFGEDGLEDDDRLVPGMVWRAFRYDWDETGDEVFDQPNFSFGGVEIRWYKHRGRSQSANVFRTPEFWVRWFDEAMLAIRRSECAHFRARNGHCRHFARCPYEAAS